jgi:hypothetical protein
MPRHVISATELYAVLDREYRRRRPAQCNRCKMPLPFLRTSPDSVSANWAIGTPSECPENCQAVIAEILVEMWARYEMQSADRG